MEKEKEESERENGERKGRLRKERGETGKRKKNKEKIGERMDVEEALQENRKESLCCMGYLGCKKTVWAYGLGLYRGGGGGGGGG